MYPFSDCKGTKNIRITIILNEKNHTQTVKLNIIEHFKE